MFQLVTPRLLIRPWQISDLAELVALSRQDGFSDNTSGAFARLSEDRAREAIEREARVFSARGLGRLGVFERENLRAIGLVGLHEMSEPRFQGEVGLGYRFPKTHWGQGFATEAVREVLRYGIDALRLPRIHAIIAPENTRSKRVAVKLEMRYENTIEYKGEMREHWLIHRESIENGGVE